jgi:hypothetical protein
MLYEQLTPPLTLSTPARSIFDLVVTAYSKGGQIRNKYFRLAPTSQSQHKHLVATRDQTLGQNQ